MRKFFHAFVFAGKGIYTAIIQEQNFRFHICAAAYVYLFSLFYPFGKLEYCIITILVASVMAAELFNSAIERIVGPPEGANKTEEKAQEKDMTAGAVLVLSIAAAICGIILFWNIPVFINIFRFFSENIIVLLLFILSLFVSYWFIYRFDTFKNWNKKRRKS